jgi:sortase A
VDLRVTTIRLIYRVLLTAGIIALLWVGGELGYAKIFQLYQLSRLKSQAVSANEHVPSSLRNGDLVGRLDILERKISVVVVEGVDEETLAIAAGHVPGTSVPGSNGNVVIAAHRDTFFRELRNIHRGNTIQLSTPRGTFAYVVTNTEIVKPSETRVLESSGHPELTLVTCYPFSFLGAAPKRFIVHARPQFDQTGS